MYDIPKCIENKACAVCKLVISATGRHDCLELSWPVSNTANENSLTHSPLDKMSAISQTTFSNTFSEMKSCIFCLLWRVQLTMSEHWFKPLHELMLISWWRHQMEAFSLLLALCAGNSPVTDEFPAQRPVTRNFDVFFDLHPNKSLSKQS